MTKKGKVFRIILLVILAYFLFAVTFGIFNILSQDGKGISDIIPNIVMIPVTAFFIIRTIRVLKGKARPIKESFERYNTVLTLTLLAFCFLFAVSTFVFAVIEGEFGLMLFMLVLLIAYVVSFRNFCKKGKEEEAHAPKIIQNHSQWEHAESQVKRHTPVYLDDVTFVRDVKYISLGPWKQYDVLLAARGYGWDMMKDWADYMAQADLIDISQVVAGSMGTNGTDYTQAYSKNGKKCMQTPELETEKGMLSIAGFSQVLNEPMRIVWFNQTRTLRLFTTVNDDTLIACYVETMVRRTFGTEDALKLGQPLPDAPTENKDPVSFENGQIHIDSGAFFAWKKKNNSVLQYEKLGSIALSEKEPVISVYEDGVKTREYRLQTEGDEDFSGKFFLTSVRLGIQGRPAVPVAQIDGFISDTDEDRKMTVDDVGYRMEGLFLACGERAGALRYQMIRGRDLPAKGLKYPGYTTPSNIRLVGICPDCGKSFCFHGYAFYMVQCDVAYSDDGLSCCEIVEYNIDKENWVYETEGKTFRYYNSFNCPHCGTPYIDYRKFPEDKVFGVSGCVHLNRKYYRSQ